MADTLSQNISVPNIGFYVISEQYIPCGSFLLNSKLHSKFSTNTNTNFINKIYFINNIQTVILKLVSNISTEEKEYEHSIISQYCIASLG